MTLARAALCAVLAVACDVGGGGDRTEDPVEPGQEQEPPPAPLDGGPPLDAPGIDGFYPMPEESDDVDGGAEPETQPEPEPEPEPEHPDPSGSTWSNVDKCNQMCGAYCMKRQICDGTPVDACRDAIDDDNGGPCESRGHTFEGISQARVEECIDAIQAMSCSSFMSMFNSGSGVPAPCQGILN